ERRGLQLGELAAEVGHGDTKGSIAGDEAEQLVPRGSDGVVTESTENTDQSREIGSAGHGFLSFISSLPSSTFAGRPRGTGARPPRRTGASPAPGPRPTPCRAPPSDCAAGGNDSPQFAGVENGFSDIDGTRPRVPPVSPTAPRVSPNTATPASLS